MSNLIGFTEILTLNGVKQIKDVETGDIVVGQNNTLNNVIGVHKTLVTDQTNLYQVDVYMPCNDRHCNYNFKSVVTTGEQEFYTITKDDTNPKWRTVNDMLTEPLKLSIGMPSYNIDYEQRIINKALDDDDDSKEYYLNHLDDEDFCMLLGMFFINGKFIEDKGIEFNVATKRSIILGSGVGPDISDLEYVETFMKNKFNVEPTVREDITMEHLKYAPKITKLVYMDQTVTEYFLNTVGPNNLVKTILQWTRQKVAQFISGLFTNKYELSPYCPKLYIANYDTANTLCHLFNSQSIECQVHETKFDKQNYRVFERYNLNSDNYKYHILLNHTFVFYKYDCEPNSPRLLGKYKFENYKNGKEYFKFLNVKEIKPVTEHHEYVYSLTLDNDNTYSVGGLVCKGL